jgi:hypothetical protein
MDAVWSVMKSKNVMGISSWIKRFLVVALRRRRLWRQQTSWHRRARRSSLRRPRPISKVPGGYPTLPRSQRQGTLLQRWWSCPPSHPEHGRTTQAQLALGRSLHSRKGDRTGILLPPDTWRWRRQQLMEHRPTLSVLRLHDYPGGSSLHDYIKIPSP